MVNNISDKIKTANNGYASNTKRIKTNVVNNISNPIMNSDISNVYFQSANSISNINKGLIKFKSPAFGSAEQYKNYNFRNDPRTHGYTERKVSIFEKGKITNKDLTDRKYDDIYCYDAQLSGARKLSYLETNFKKAEGFFDIDYYGEVKLSDNVQVNRIDATADVYLYDNVESNNLKTTGNAHLFSKAKASSINAIDIIMSGDSEAIDISCNEIELSDNAKIKGTTTFKNKANIKIKQSKDGSLPYINPFLIKTSNENFHPNELLYQKDNSETARYMPETVYFNSNYKFVNDYIAKDVESKASLDFFDNSKANNVVAQKNVLMKDNSEISSIIADEVFITDNSEVGSINANKIKTGNSATIKEVKSSYIETFDASKINNIESDYTRICNLSRIDSLKSSNVEIWDSSMVNNMISEKNIDLKGNGSVGNITCKSNKIIITGPIKINGKIKFSDTPGEIIIIKDKNGDFAKISSENVENGIIKSNFKTKHGDIVISNEKLFTTGLASTLFVINQPDIKQVLGKYKNIDIIKTLYKDTNTKLTEKLEELYCNEDNKIKIEKLYDDFAKNTLLNLASADDAKGYTPFWAQHKKIGRKNLTDFWLMSLNLDIKDTKYSEKAKMLNTLSNVQKEQLIGKTVDYWISKILPVELDKINKNDIKYMQLDQAGLDTIEEIKNSRKEELIKIIDNEGIEKFESCQQGSKTLLDFWIDTIDGEGSANDCNSRMKQKRLKEIFNSDEDMEKIYKATIEESNKLSTQIKRIKESYIDLIEDADLGKTAKNILEEYQNNQLFFYIVNGKAKNKNSIVSLEISTKNILEELSTEKEKIMQDTRKNIFTPIKDFEYLAGNTEKVESEGHISFIFSLIQDKIKNSTPGQADKIKKALEHFSNIVSKHGDDIDSEWSTLVNIAEKHFEDVHINKVTDAHIKQIFVVNTALEKPLSTEVESALKDETLEIDQKGFIARYKENKNLIKLLKQPTCDPNKDINNLIGIEKLNNSLFDAISLDFRRNITPEMVNLMPEMTDAYLNQLGVDSTKLKEQQKYNYLSKMTSEELELVSKEVKKYWNKNFLEKAINEKIQEKVENYDPGSQLNQVNQGLKHISIQIEGQTRTLDKISKDIDHYIDLYKETSFETNNKLDKIAKTMEDIHIDTSNIKNNIKNLLIQSIASTQDPVLRGELEELLKDSDGMELSEFLKTVDRKQIQYKKDHRYDAFCEFMKKNVIKPALIAGSVIAVSHFLPIAAPFLIAHGLPVVGGFLATLPPYISTAVQTFVPTAGIFTSILKPKGINIDGNLA